MRSTPRTLILLVGFLLVPKFCGATSCPLDIAVRQLGANGADPSYTIGLRINGIGSVFFSGTFISPDGVSHTLSQLNQTLTPVATFTDFANHYFGTWTIQDHPSPGSAVYSYQFTLSPFALDSVFHSIPQIVSPAEGATVGTTFVVDWQWSSTTAPIGEVSIFSGSASIPTVTATWSAAGGDATYVYPEDAVVPFPVTLREGAITNIGQFFSNIVPIGMPGPDTFSYSTPPSFWDFSAPLTVTVVPEPASIMLLGTGLTLFIVRSRAAARNANCKRDQ